jgi:hypothetical protein
MAIAECTTVEEDGDIDIWAETFMSNILYTIVIIEISFVVFRNQFK